MIGQKKRLTASAARRKHSVTAAIFDCCTLICRIGEKLAVYPSQMPRVPHNVQKRGKIVISLLVAVDTIIDGDKPNTLVSEHDIANMEKTTKSNCETDC